MSSHTNRYDRHTMFLLITLCTLLLATHSVHGFQLRLPRPVRRLRCGYLRSPFVRRTTRARHRLKELQWETTLLPELFNGTDGGAP